MDPQPDLNSYLVYEGIGIGWLSKLSVDLATGQQDWDYQGERQHTTQLLCISLPTQTD